MRHLTALLTVLFVGLFAHTTYGVEALQVTDVGTSARMLALGQIEGFDDSAVSVLENPAALYRVKENSFAGFTTTLFNEVDYRSLAYARNTKYGVVAVGFMGSLVDGIPETATQNVGGEEKFVSIGNFNVSHSLLKLGHQFSLKENLHIGTALNYYSNSIHTVKGNGFNLDVGAIYEKDAWTFSHTFRNLVKASKLNYSNGNYEYLPFQTVTGVQYHVGYFDFLAQYKRTSAFDKGLKSLGVHFNPRFMDFIHINAGYKEFQHLDDVGSHYTLGVGLTLHGIGFDYAYEKSEHLLFDNNSYFSMKFSF